MEIGNQKIVKYRKIYIFNAKNVTTFFTGLLLSIQIDLNKISFKILKTKNYTGKPKFFLKYFSVRFLPFLYFTTVFFQVVPCGPKKL